VAQASTESGRPSSEVGAGNRHRRQKIHFKPLKFYQMKGQKINRDKHLHVRLTPEEYQKLFKQFTTSSSQKLSEHIRKILLDKPIKMYHRNQSIDDLMAVLILLKDELNAIANNYNQVVKKLHMLNDKSDLSGWLSLNEIGRKALHEKVTEIKDKISQISEKWLQE